MSGETFDVKSLNLPDEVRTFEKGKVELVHVAGPAIGRATFDPGWKCSECVKPIAKTNRCQAAHYGYQVSGTMTTRMDRGAQGTSQGFALVHGGWVVEPAIGMGRPWIRDRARCTRQLYRYPGLLQNHRPEESCLMVGFGRPTLTLLLLCME